MFGVFLAQKLSGSPVTIVGDGNQTRDFTYVNDVAHAIYATMNSEISGEIFNIGSGTTVSENCIVELIGGEKIFIPKRPGEPDCTYADISKIKTKLGWKPQTNIEDGVRKIM